MAKFRMEKPTFGLRSNAVVVALNAEMADMSCPNGEIMGEEVFVIVTDAHGNRKRHKASTFRQHGNDIIGQVGTDPEGFYTQLVTSDYPMYRLEALAERLNALQPELDTDCWTDIDPQFGSPAWVDFEPYAVHREREEDRF